MAVDEKIGKKYSQKSSSQNWKGPGSRNKDAPAVLHAKMAKKPKRQGNSSP